MLLDERTPHTMLKSLLARFKELHPDPVLRCRFLVEIISDVRQPIVVTTHALSEDEQRKIDIKVCNSDFNMVPGKSVHFSDYAIIKDGSLDVTFDQLLNFDDHITAICRSTYFHIRNIGKMWNLLSYNACSTIIHALISCR